MREARLGEGWGPRWENKPWQPAGSPFLHRQPFLPGLPSLSPPQPQDPLEVKKGQTFCKVPSAIQFPKPHYLTVTPDQSYLCVFSVDAETVFGAMRWLVQLMQLWEGRLTEEEGVRTQTWVSCIWLSIHCSWTTPPPSWWGLWQATHCLSFHICEMVQSCLYVSLHSIYWAYHRLRAKKDLGDYLAHPFIQQALFFSNYYVPHLF